MIIKLPPLEGYVYPNPNSVYHKKFANLLEMDPIESEYHNEEYYLVSFKLIKHIDDSTADFRDIRYKKVFKKYIYKKYIKLISPGFRLYLKNLT